MPNKFTPGRPSPQRFSNLQPPNSQYTGEFQTVDPRFLLKSLGAILTLALILAYITLCVVFYQQQWQLVLHPSRELAQQPDSVGLNFVEVHFGVDATGQPQLDGWWLPSDNPADPTILLLHSGDGAMSAALPLARRLHDANVNLLLFDYRGYGHSGGQHPTEASMQADTETAYSYLVDERHIAPASLAVFGDGSSGALAVKLCSTHGLIPALVLMNADGDFEARAAQDVRSHFVPVRLLFHEDFPLAAPLSSLATPKLLISTDRGSALAAFKTAADPKMTVELPSSDSNGLQSVLSRFLGENVAGASASFRPNP